MKKSLVPAVLMTAAIFVSCKNDDNIAEVKKLPKSITSVDTNLSFSYSTTGQLVKVIDKDSETAYTETIFTYDSSGKVTKFVTIYNDPISTETNSYTITYPSATQAKVADEDNDYILVNFNDKGQVLNFNFYGDLTTFTYDNKGNVVKIVDENTTTTASYNSDKGVLSGITSPKWVLLLSDFDLHFFGENNPITVTEVAVFNGTTYNSSETYSYPIAHIIDGYPTRMSVNYNENGSTTNEVYTVSY
ncbi:hypothetical protein [Paenimyroides aestuarii]|uniref:YD repeat-containing protein n=1 Tax=Paenimyroides aestuarii TaxID=2968490 RepID=A0ABY5NVR5_9FLAO|nr:hypothetical protein [Paenimyroides aestuarii]UUV22676.1 hypothetical protein NPX36_06440 [Paenimyroides aestuarii]